MKYYSELLDKFYDSKQELVEEEGDYEIKRARKEEAEKNWEKRYNDAKQKATDALNEFINVVKEQPQTFKSARCDFKRTTLFDELDDLLKFFWN